MKQNIGLVLLAAGFGRRFGGDKQLSAVGPQSAIIMDYTIFDAWRIGYSWVTVILRRDMLERFEREVGCRWRSRIELRYSIQDNAACVPDPFRVQQRAEKPEKPLGTAHALLCAAAQVDGPFAVANADDFYGYHGLKEIFFFLRSTQNTEEPKQGNKILHQAMVGFQLGRTLSDNGAVCRGICHSHADAKGREWLQKIEEYTGLQRQKDGRIAGTAPQNRPGQNKLGQNNLENAEDSAILTEQTPVSMNLFGLQPEVFGYLQQQFEVFLQNLPQTQNLGSKPTSGALPEFYLPSAVEVMLEREQTSVAMLHSPDPWFGLTYFEDLPLVRSNIEKLITEGQYPANLFG